MGISDHGEVYIVRGLGPPWLQGLSLEKKQGKRAERMMTIDGRFYDPDRTFLSKQALFTITGRGFSS